MRVLEPFGFRDSANKKWLVPVNAEVDGASIPQVLWSLTGGPFEGKYRDASVVHDYYCDVRTESWSLVHRVFYDAMRASGVSEVRAKMMYAAVYFGGPRWSDTATKNTRLPRPEDNILFSVKHSEFEMGVFDAVEMNGESAAAFLRSGKWMWENGQTRLHLNQMEQLIRARNPSLAEIEKAIDQASRVLEGPFSVEGPQENRAVVSLPSA